MRDVLNLLLQLQEIDEDLGELDRSKVYLPEMIANINTEVEALEKDIGESETTLLESKKRQKQVELDIETDKEDLAKYQRQMKVIKTNKEYDALVGEIDTRKQRISDNEDEILKLMGTIEETTEKLAQSKAQLAEVRLANDATLESLKNQMESLETKIADKQKQRGGLVKTVDRKALSMYERIRKGKGGMAVVPLRKRACGGCFKQIPPQLTQEIRRGDKLYTCDSCGRILIWIDDEE
jgi:predicted  nucleic acid-binding Zn-ribbon protein